MRVFKNAWFVKFAKQEGITNVNLSNAIGQAEDGLVDADLGGGLIKLRIARHGSGKSGGYRTIVCFKKGERAIFVFGFAKSKIENLPKRDLEALKKLAKSYFALSEIELEDLKMKNQLEEISNNG
jgi:hypothetical protein